MSSIIIAPSILSADFARLGEQVTAVKAAPWLHLDVMDGAFVPNISFGAPVIESLRPVSQQFFDVHLMIEHPERHIERFVEAGADLITVHAEACVHLHRVVEQIHRAGAQAGVAINPHTPVAAVEWMLPEVELVLVMSVNPGFGGQAFLPRTMAKVEQLRRRITEEGLATRIEVDGGIDANTAVVACRAGADVLVAGSAIFRSPDPAAALQQLMACVVPK